MKYDEQKSDESESGGHLGAVAGLIIGIILGSLMLNFPITDRSAQPSAQANTANSYIGLGNG
jgi:ABC-type nitrate/sulfonate/bicarbonate transport system permease component